MSYTLGIDIGTYESKGVLVDHAGQILAQTSTPHKMIVPKSGWAEHRPDEDWWMDFVAICRALLKQSKIDPKAISCVSHSAIGPCMLPVDKTGKPLMNAVLYGVDTRAMAQIDELNTRLGESAIHARCGNALTSQAVGPKVLWLRQERPDLFSQTAMILTATSYITYRLTDEYVIDHHSAAGFTPLYDAGTQSWCEPFCDDIIATDKLPKLVWPTEVVGQITSQAAAETGLAAGTPVTSGTIDAAAEALSVGVSTPGDVMLMYGSTMFLIQVTKNRIDDPRMWYAPWIIPGSHTAMGGTATSGTLTHWFRDQLARDLPKDTAFEAMVEEANTSPPGANGLLFLPYFSGERTPLYDAAAKGSFHGLTLTHTRADMIRAMFEGIAGSAAHILALLSEAEAAPNQISAVGGGTKNAVWLQTVSDLSRLPQKVNRVTTGAAYGDAFLAALAIGAVDLNAIQSWNPVTSSIAPNPDTRLDAQYQQCRALYEATLDLNRTC